MGMGLVQRDYGQTAYGEFLRCDTGNYPSGAANYDPMGPNWSDPTRAVQLRQENIGSLIAAYRTGRYLWLYQDVSSLTAQMPLGNVYPLPPAYLQPLSTVYTNIALSPSLGGKAG